MQSMVKGGQGHSSEDDGHDDEVDDDEEEDDMDGITNLNQQAELRRELIATIEEAIREQEALKKHNMDL